MHTKKNILNEFNKYKIMYLITIKLVEYPKISDALTAIDNLLTVQHLCVIIQLWIKEWILYTTLLDLAIT